MSRPTLSIITAIHNQLEVNKVFLRSLRKNTSVDYELIIVDNHSTDGSSELFAEAGAIVLRQGCNHCYPESQNIGMKHAKGKYLAFLNNDIYLAPEWDQRILRAMQEHHLDAAGLCSFEVVEDPTLRRKLSRRWKWLRRGKRHLKMTEMQLLQLMDRLYGRKGFEHWVKGFIAKNEGHIYPGLTGSALVTTKELWDKLGAWDVRAEAADWNLHILLCKRAEERGDVRPPMIVADAWHHHFARMTFYSQPEPRACDHAHLRIEELWSAEEIRRYGPRLPEEEGLTARIRRWIKRLRPRSRIHQREEIE